MNPNQEYFQDSFQKSLSDIYKDFYREEEISFLREELYSIYKDKLNSDLTIHVYKPNENDPLLRINLNCITILCNSMPFFAAKIRELFYIKKLDINRSLHFHPSDSQEFYYIEIQNLENDIEEFKKIIIDSYQKINTYTQDYDFLVKKRPDLYKNNFDENHVKLLDWLLTNSFVWEGGYFFSEDEQYSLGKFQKEGQIWEWFQKIPFEEDKSNFYARESTYPSYLNDGNLYYIVFTSKGKKLLIEGTFNQRGARSSIMEIPLMKDRLMNFMLEERIQPFSGLGRTVRMVFNYIPTEVLFLIPYKSYISIYGAIVEQSLKTNIRSNGIKLKENLALIITIIPEKYWSESKWENASKIISEEFLGAYFKKYEVLVKNYIQGYYLIRTDNIHKQALFQASSRIEYLFKPWIEHVRTKWEDRYKNEKFPEKLEFSDDYITTHDPEKAVSDLGLIKKLNDDKIVLRLRDSGKNLTEILAISRDITFPLSTWVTVISDLHLSTNSQRIYAIQMNEIHYIKTEFQLEHVPNDENFYDRVKDVLVNSLNGNIVTDSLSGIVRKTNLNVHALFFLKSIREYCLQTNPSFNRHEFNEILLKYPDFCKELWVYFESKFFLGKVFSEEKLKESSEKATTLLEDSVLSSMKTSTIAIVRTNFFGVIHDWNEKKIGVDRKFVAYKINSAIPSSLPDPRPYREIFVYSSDFQGIHLRGGQVARGGLRYSDRNSDFRTEILSLMKTQMVKNSVIVPVGSKGGFVLSKNPYNNQEITMVEAYKKYILSLISLTDNRIKGNEIYFSSKNGPYAYDDYDPYLVVAADKGTAQLSDTANSISLENNFWLGDAFASGGSKGYSHKEYGITAKGALVTADRHLRNLEIDFRNEPITLIGIGDMGGDVFGNGLLESQHYKLLAAFNHKHIFLDPNPDPGKSYEERKRLFFDKNSGWDFYDKNLISKGGGVFLKSEKKISISPEVKIALDIKEDYLSGQALVTAILKAPVDLFFNGGIGTYVKSELEENSKVGDPANNEVRINGKELRARVVCEGGNLGFTQLGRIEYDLSKGRIYTDALDNSAGVDLSDHEVNLKIFCNMLLERKVLNNLEERDVLLKKIDKEVCQKVLRDNALQSLSIESDYLESQKFGWEGIIEVSQYLVKKNILNPITEKIPMSSQEWLELKENTQSIPRPILCVLLGYVKMDLYNEMLGSKYISIEDYKNIYSDYFPETLLNSFQVEVFHHPLSSEILLTQLVNFFVNLLGIRSTVLLGLDTEERKSILNTILLDLNQNGLFEVANELSLVRDKLKEKEIVHLVLELRSKVYGKWEKKSNMKFLTESGLKEKISENSWKKISHLFQ
jgi:glutamate dehydrogenase